MFKEVCLYFKSIDFSIVRSDPTRRISRNSRGLSGGTPLYNTYVADMAHVSCTNTLFSEQKPDMYIWYRWAK